MNGLEMHQNCFRINAFNFVCFVSIEIEVKRKQLKRKQKRGEWTRGSAHSAHEDAPVLR